MKSILEAGVGGVRQHVFRMGNEFERYDQAPDKAGLRVNSESRKPARQPPHRELLVNGVHVRLGTRIGAGRYSYVYAGQDEWGNSLVAKVYRAYAPSALWENEVCQLRRFQHRHVVQILGALELDRERYILLMHGGQPVSRVRAFATQHLRERFALNVARGLLQALHVIHKENYVHGDVNPGNCLVWRRGASMEVRLADFAFCRPLGAAEDEFARFAQWMPLPERLDPALGELGTCSDIYLAALLLLELLTGRVEDGTPENALSGKLQHRAACHDRRFVRELAPALAPNTSDRPRAIELWRALVRALSSESDKRIDRN